MAEVRGFCFWQSTKSADKEESDILFNTFLILFALFFLQSLLYSTSRASMLLFSWLSLEQKLGPAIMFRNLLHDLFWGRRPRFF